MEEYVNHPMYKYMYESWLNDKIELFITKICELNGKYNEQKYTAHDLNRMFLAFLREFKQRPIEIIRQVNPDLEVFTTPSPK